ncbi:MAG TPA: hypothetical protein VFQ76_04420, partial [Longimicrobiaceae bacterium]|nr:hypothetical protein [Longimicrobiaceae bacterium]
GRLREERGDRPLAPPLVTLADFIVRGVPREVASSVVFRLVHAGVPDRTYAALRRSVAQDISRGTPPAEAASRRARTALLPPRSPWRWRPRIPVPDVRRPGPPPVPTPRPPPS